MANSYTPQQMRNKVDAADYITRAIEMLKDLPEIKKSPFTAGYNGIISLLGYAKDSHAAALNFDVVNFLKWLSSSSGVNCSVMAGSIYDARGNEFAFEDLAFQYAEYLKTKKPDPNE
jgi:hypothetical protein